MTSVNISSLLSYGAIGLGCALALFSFWLLQKEQKIKAPRKEMLKAINVFIAFSLILALAGFALEFLKGERERAYNLASQNGAALQKLKSSSQQLRSLMSLKEWQVKRLGQAIRDDDKDPMALQALRDLETTIRSIDDQINAAIKEIESPPS